MGSQILQTPGRDLRTGPAPPPQLGEPLVCSTHTKHLAALAMQVFFALNRESLPEKKAVGTRLPCLSRPDLATIAPPCPSSLGKWYASDMQVFMSQKQTTATAGWSAKSSDQRIGRHSFLQSQDKYEPLTLAGQGQSHFKRFKKKFALSCALN